MVRKHKSKVLWITTFSVQIGSDCFCDSRINHCSSLWYFVCSSQNLSKQFSVLWCKGLIPLLSSFWFWKHSYTFRTSLQCSIKSKLSHFICIKFLSALHRCTCYNVHCISRNIQCWKDLISLLFNFEHRAIHLKPTSGIKNKLSPFISIFSFCSSYKTVKTRYLYSTSHFSTVWIPLADLSSLSSLLFQRLRWHARTTSKQALVSWMTPLSCNILKSYFISIVFIRL